MDYLAKLQQTTRTRYWVNNPSLDEARSAVAHGAFACTTNPAHCSKILQSDAGYIKALVRRVLRDGTSPVDAPERIYHLACKDLMDIFLPRFNAEKGSGYVTVQEDPRREEDSGYIIAASLRSAALAPNYMAKIPVTAPGLKVIDAMVERDIPLCVTEIFSISQAVAVWEKYNTAAKKYGKRPPMFVTHITGIMDDYFADLTKKERIAISPEALEVAGTAIALKQYALFKSIGVPCHMLGGGVRRRSHFTNFVGGDMHVTINWSTALELMAADIPMENAIDRAVPSNLVDELLEKLPNFRRAFDEDAMDAEEFADYGPVMLFRTQFMNGWSRLIDEVRIAASER